MEAERPASDAELVRRQAAAALRHLVRPAAYLGLAREAVAGAGHALAYPFGILPQRVAVRGTAGAGGPGEVAGAGIGPGIGLGRSTGPGADGHALLSSPSQETWASRSVRQRALLARDPVTACMPVVLVHGYFHNRSAFVAMGRTLRRVGFSTVHTFSYNPIVHALDQIAARLATEVEGVLAATGSERCMVVGHSMGGVVARCYVQQFGGEHQVDTVVTLGAPHRGTYTSYLGVGRATAQLRPGSVFLRRLEASSRPSGVRWIAYHSDFDVMITPAANAMLAHPALQATNIRLRDTGHLSLLVSGEVLRGVTDHLVDRQRGRPQPRPVPPCPP